MNCHKLYLSIFSLLLFGGMSCIFLYEYLSSSYECTPISIATHKCTHVSVTIYYITSLHEEVIYECIGRGDGPCNYTLCESNIKLGHTYWCTQYRDTTLLSLHSQYKLIYLIIMSVSSIILFFSLVLIHKMDDRHNMFSPSDEEETYITVEGKSINI